jgi:hypothetical protein
MHDLIFQGIDGHDDPETHDYEDYEPWQTPETRRSRNAWGRAVVKDVQSTKERVRPGESLLVSADYVRRLVEAATKQVKERARFQAAQRELEEMRREVKQLQQILARTPSASIILADEGLRAEFHALAERWRLETGGLSSIMRIIMHPAYQRIIGMGPVAIPMILDDLARTEDHWFWALQSITGENPIPKEASGYVDRMAEAWLEWGRQHGMYA